MKNFILLSFLIFFLSSCSNLFFQPSNVLYYTPKQFKIDSEQVSFKSKDGTTIFAWILKPSKIIKKKSTIIQFHGNAENMSTHFLSLAWLVKEGHQVITFDYRGYGISKGKPSMKGVLEDCLAFLNYSFNYHKKTHGHKFVVYGQSLGGVFAARSVYEWVNKDKVDLLVLDSTFSSFKDIAFDKLTDSFLTFILSPLAYIIISDQVASEDYLSILPDFQKLVVHGEKDLVVPYKFGQEIFGILKGKKEFWKVENGKHIDAFSNIHQGKYRNLFVSYLNNL